MQFSFQQCFFFFNLKTSNYLKNFYTLKKMEDNFGMIPFLCFLCFLCRGVGRMLDRKLSFRTRQME